MRNGLQRRVFRLKVRFLMQSDGFGPRDFERFRVLVHAQQAECLVAFLQGEGVAPGACGDVERAALLG